MNLKIKERLPDWYKNIDNTRDKLILTNDIDSLLSCSLLKQLFGVEIKSFYNFKALYFADCKRKGFIGVDLDSCRGRIFGNHITYYKNPDAINLNNVFDISYYQKYPFNTVMLICFLYDIDIKKWTDEQLQVLLSIDSAYKGYYTNNLHFKKVYTNWLDRLGYRFLEDRILKSMTMKDFTQTQRKYNLNGSIKMGKSGRLKTNIKLDKLNKLFSDIIHIELPQDEFKKGRDFTLKQVNPVIETVVPQELIFSMAWTYKNQLKMSLF